MLVIQGPTQKLLECSNLITASHSTTSLARSKVAGGTKRPSAWRLGVLRLGRAVAAASAVASCALAALLWRKKGPAHTLRAQTAENVVLHLFVQKYVVAGQTADGIKG